MLAWASLVQFPFSAPIYFCYVTPLAVVVRGGPAGHNARAHSSRCRRSGRVLLAFALASMNRGYVYNLGVVHEVMALDRAARVSNGRACEWAGADAVTYRRLMKLIATHIGDGQLVAGPDAPEVYFLTGRFSPSGTLFDFFDDQRSPEGGMNDMPGWPAAQRRRAEPQPPVLVRDHRPHLAAKVRQQFPHSKASARSK